MSPTLLRKVRNESNAGENVLTYFYFCRGRRPRMPSTWVLHSSLSPIRFCRFSLSIPVSSSSMSMYVVAGAPLRRLPWRGSHIRSWEHNSSLRRQQCPAKRRRRCWISLESVGMFPYSSVLRTLSSQVKPRVLRSIRVNTPSSFFCRVWVRVQVSAPYSNILRTRVWKSWIFMLLFKEDFQILSSLLWAFHAWAMRIFISVEEEANQDPRYLKSLTASNSFPVFTPRQNEGYCHHNVVVVCRHFLVSSIT